MVTTTVKIDSETSTSIRENPFFLLVFGNFGDNVVGREKFIKKFTIYWTLICPAAEIVTVRVADPLSGANEISAAVMLFWELL